jgi:hypothetical protein
MSKSIAEREYKVFLEEQMSHATGMRLELLKKQGEGERMLLVDILWPIRKTFKGLILEKEIVTLTGVKAYIDAFDDAFRLGFEGEGFIPHAEMITRPRFDFEKLKIRSMVAYGIKYIHPSPMMKWTRNRINVEGIYTRYMADMGLMPDQYPIKQFPYTNVK